MKGTSFILLLTLGVAIAGCSSQAPSTSDAKPADKQTKATTAANKLTKLKIEDVVPGKGRPAEDGDILTVLYRGSLENGTVFDSNMDEKGEPDTSKDAFMLPLGMGQVIKGWDQGLVGIKVGGERKISIPSELGYGDKDNPKIPANSDLYFDVKCLDIIHKGEELVIDPVDTKVGTGPAVKEGDKITIHFVGTLLNGKQFDSTRDKNEPLTFTVGKHEVLACLEEGVVGMKKGGLRRLRVPPKAAIGSSPMSGMPMNQVLIFNIELLKIDGK